MPGPFEYDCVECGNHIVAFCAEMPAPPLCAFCLFVPGWIDDPEIVAVLDPDLKHRPPRVQDEG